MNPFVWRFIGGYGTSRVIDHIVPDYWRHAAQGANVAIWGAGSYRGRAAEFVGRQITRGAKAVARPVARVGGRIMVRAGGRLIPIVGWGMLAADAIYLISYMTEKSPTGRPLFYNPTPGVGFGPQKPVHELMDDVGIGWGLS